MQVLSACSRITAALQRNCIFCMTRLHACLHASQQVTAALQRNCHFCICACTRRCINVMHGKHAPPRAEAKMHHFDGFQASSMNHCRAAAEMQYLHRVGARQLHQPLQSPTKNDGRRGAIILILAGRLQSSAVESSSGNATVRKRIEPSDDS